MSLEAQRDAANKQADELAEAREETFGCFNAAFAEGLHKRMEELEDRQPGSIYDLLQRRLMWAYERTIPGALAPKAAAEVKADSAA